MRNVQACDELSKGAKMTVKLTDKQQKTIRLVYSVILSVLTVVSGVLLIVQAERIYHTVGKYSREIVSEYLGQISVVLYIWIAFVIVGAILWLVLPPEQKKLRATIYSTDTLKRLQKRIPAGAVSEKLHRAEIIKLVVWGVAIVFAIVSIVMVGVVVFDSDYYHLDANNFRPMEDMLDMLPHFMPWVAAAFFVAIAVSIYTEISAKYEVAEIKRLIVESKNNPTSTENAKEDKLAILKNKLATLKDNLTAKIPEIVKTAKFRTYALLGVRISLAVLAIALIIVGVLNGGLLDVLEKAATICRECIGLG